MSLEYPLMGFEGTLAGLQNTPANLAVQPGVSWALGRIVLAGFCLLYLVGVVRDVQRVRDLRAEPSPLGKIIVITKNEAWQRVNLRLVRSAVRDNGTRLGSRGAPPR